MHVILGSPEDGGKRLVTQCSYKAREEEEEEEHQHHIASVTPGQLQHKHPKLGGHADCEGTLSQSL